MSEKLKDKANEISLMLVMTAENDAVGLGLILELYSELFQLISESPEHNRLGSAIRDLQSRAESPNLFTLLNEFTTSVTQYLENNAEITFPTERGAVPTNIASADVSPDIDTRFLTEYIETHLLQLEDFESSLIECQGNASGMEETTTLVKRYLHNLKGDSGSIGLPGIEKVCHTLEDLLTVHSLAEFTPQLLIFKEWMLQCLNSYARGKFDEQPSEAFLKGLTLIGGAAPEQAEKPVLEKETSPVTTPASQPKKLEDYALTGEKDLLLEFVSEAEEHLANLEGVVLDCDGSFSQDAVDTIFRSVHSLKGGSAYFGIEEMTRCSHILENMLSLVRDGKRVFDEGLRALLLTYIDLEKDVLARAKQAVTRDGIMKRSQSSVDFLERLDAYQRGDSSTPVPQTSARRETLTADPPNLQASSASAPVLSERDGGHRIEKLQIKTYVKVDTARLDHLIDSIGEMVIYSSMLIRNCRMLLADNREIMDAAHRVEKFSRDLQDVGMSMRLVPIKGLFQKMSRLVWDTSKKIGKEVNFVMEGEDTELDRNLIDKLADPLMHMVRNSIDHGIELPDERVQKGKSRAGNVKLSAFHSGGSIHIKVEDDGKGLDPEKLVAKAIEKGIVKDGQKLNQSETFQLIFAAGFSTAAVVTDISGRGVGMDVVRRNVESLRGRINIDSKLGAGSTFTIELPLTLAIIDGIQVSIGSESFIIPSLAIVEFVRPKQDMLANTLDRGETLHFRGSYLPIFRLADLYRIRPRYHDSREATMVVVENGHERVALMVDDILGECSTVIKSLGTIFEEGKGLAGCAIMPQGNVALILDVRSLIQLARSAPLDTAKPSLRPSFSAETDQEERVIH